MNITENIPTLVCSSINVSDPEIDKASKIFASICELIFHRGRAASSPTVNRCDALCVRSNISAEFSDSSAVRTN